MIGIYKITSPTGAIYIGQSLDIEKRWNHYKNLYCKDQRRIYNSLKKHGHENHIFEVVLIVNSPCLMYKSVKIMDFYEQLFIDYYKKIGCDMMNLRDAGSNGKMGDETKKRISLALKGKIRPNMRGRKLSAETIAKLKEARAKQVYSGESKEKISASLKKYFEAKGRNPTKPVQYPRENGKFSEAQRLRYSIERSGELGYFFGKKHSEETRKAMSLKRVGMYIGDTNPKAKAIIQFDLCMNFIKEYSTINQAASELNISRQAINCCCSGRTKTSHGYIWKYKTPKEKAA